ILFWSATTPRSDCPHHNPIRSAHRESNPYQANSIHSFDSPFLSVGSTVCLTFRPFRLTLCAGSRVLCLRRQPSHYRPVPRYDVFGRSDCTARQSGSQHAFAISSLRRAEANGTQEAQEAVTVGAVCDRAFLPAVIENARS